MTDFNETIDIIPDDPFQKTSDLEQKSDVFNLENSDLKISRNEDGSDENSDPVQVRKITDEYSSMPAYVNGRCGPQGHRYFVNTGNIAPSTSWVDEVFLNRQKRLNQRGIATAQDYMRSLAAVDEALETHPQEVIQRLCDVYGVNVPPMSKKTSAQKVREFQSAKDENGSLKYPYFQAVRSTMADLLQKGLADDLSGAYQKAIWLDDNVRAHLLGYCFHNELNRKAAAAQKAKTASFSPHSKSVSSSGAEKTLREEIEEIYYNLI